MLIYDTWNGVLQKIVKYFINPLLIHWLFPYSISGYPFFIRHKVIKKSLQFNVWQQSLSKIKGSPLLMTSFHNWFDVNDKSLTYITISLNSTFIITYPLLSFCFTHRKQESLDRQRIPGIKPTATKESLNYNKSLFSSYQWCS